MYSLIFYFLKHCFLPQCYFFLPEGVFRGCVWQVIVLCVCVGLVIIKISIWNGFCGLQDTSELLNFMQLCLVAVGGVPLPDLKSLYFLGETGGLQDLKSLIPWNSSDLYPRLISWYFVKQWGTLCFMNKVVIKWGIPHFVWSWEH